MPLPNPIEINATQLAQAANLNIIVGRNGAGKSRFLQQLEELRHQGSYFVQYISPERAGSFDFDPGIEHNVRNNRNWIEDSRKRNQVTNFKQSSAKRMRDLAMRFALRLETDTALRSDHSKTFTTERLSKINAMLSNIFLEREGAEVFVIRTIDDQHIGPDRVSSGESEIIALGTEVMHFFELCEPGRTNLLLLDEPDVHLHPDLQARFARFITRELSELTSDVLESTAVCIATHSTPLICELARYPGCTIGTKHFNTTQVTQAPASDQLQKMAPFFGHPLSRVIADDVPLILEGEDDERIWQQAARTAEGRLRVFPVLSTTVSQQTELEMSCDSMLQGLYDQPVAISIRDGDGSRGSLTNVGCVKRYRLQCYAAENLLLTDDVLAALGSNWNALVQEIGNWCAANPSHKDVSTLTGLAASHDRYRDTKVKDIRQLIPAILGSKKPWEVVVGQVLGRVNPGTPDGPYSIKEYVGADALMAIGLLT